MTAARERQIVGTVARGNYVEVAARAAGIAPSTLYEWKSRGEEGGPGNEPYVGFLEALTRAEAEAEIEGVEAIRGAWNKDWRSAIEYLARRYPERWGKRDRAVSEHDEAAPLTLTDLEMAVDAEDREAEQQIHCG